VLNNGFVSKLNTDATPWSEPQLQVDHGPIPMTVELNNVSSDISNRMRDMIAVQSCSIMPPSQGYKRALQLLKHRTGNE